MGDREDWGQRPQERKMSDVFELLKCGSAAHKVKVNSDGSFTLEPLADKDSLKAFQPKAKEALQAASEGQFTIIQTHTSDGVQETCTIKSSFPAPSRGRLCVCCDGLVTQDFAAHSPATTAIFNRVSQGCHTET
jgi:hypothetical protein